MDSTKCQQPSLTARLFKKEDHEQVSEWFKSRDMVPLPLDVLSSTGIIVDGIACGFLYFTNSSVGYLEHYISNPDSKKWDRKRALELITTELIAISSKVGVKLLIAGTNVHSIEKLAIKHGFKLAGSQAVLIRGNQ